ncbi:MAG TPA: transglutaminase family protein [Polyangiaceae bacterium]
MAIRVALHHTTRYVYDRPVQLGPHVVRLRPAAHARTPIEAYSLRVSPSEHFLNWQQDPFGNWLARVIFPKPAHELVVEVDLVANLVTVNPFDFFLEETAQEFPVVYHADLKRELLPYLETSAAGSKFSQLIGRVTDDVARTGRRMVDVLVDINQLVQRSLRYDIRMEPGVFAPEETLERGHGSCRDFAWLLVNVLRRLGLAARFVSGYSIQLRPDQKPLEGPAGVSNDCTDLHAWAEVYLPGAGWIGLDATSGLLCGEGHIPLACTAAPQTAAPVTGSYAWTPRGDDDRVEERFAFDMQVTRIEDRPRPTRSYDEEQWDGIVRCGLDVDRALADGDVRLTMGGEPTFVSAEDMEAPEWNTAALGPTKERIADQLLRRLMKRFAPGALLHHGQGKWYPGEPLPRWAYSGYWRKDGEPIWRDPSLFAALPREGPATPDAAAAATTGLAEAFVKALLARLGVTTEHVVPAYEDAWYHLWRERKLPTNVDPFDSKLDDANERARLRRIFANGLATPVGYAAPLRATYDAAGTRGYEWIPGAWFLRDERLYLLPGDSPLGYRLPLDSLPWAAPEDLDPLRERDPFAPAPSLRAREHLVQPRTKGAERAASPPAHGTSARDIVRTALCVEPRGGALHVFFPPLDSLEAYLELAAKVEETAKELGTKVRLEGYLPPNDPRLERMQITPDPGVIEVNIHPAASWSSLVANTHVLYEEARTARLGTDKFMLDGRHTGTGGGNHIVLGGATAADSPFLRRPDVLRSLLAYFVNHPSLSYLFSGLFIGPTSQAPRIDEARQDSLYELDVAFAAIPKRGEPVPPWLVDRVLRNLLVDVTGNTHRTEICIDKLYNPDSASGRLGLVELRSFEMPPDARMSCAQQLLVRALVAWFWQTPYERPLVRWGTSLHDRFLLPHFVWEDLQGVVRDVSAAGFAFDPAWFAPHWEFRFPRHGVVSGHGVDVEIRHALEPWHVLGEEAGGGGTARYVDSSAERVQVRARNLIAGRHVLACNGQRVPLHSTGRAGEHVAGVRYKAWKPPSSLHPTIGVHAPLVFDVVDTWSERALFGCTYRVTHPGGRTFDVYPKNGLEAESRRATRFEPFGHTPGSFRVAARERSLEAPLTLDLRRTDL